MKMSEMIKPKSDQLNADDLISRDLTIKITKITGSGGDQPLSIYFEGDNGKPYKPGLSMRRIMIAASGKNDPTLEEFQKVYIGVSVLLHRDKTVKWAGIEVGGLRITHMSNLKKPFTMALTATSNSKKLYTVKPLKIEEAVRADPKLLKAGQVAADKGSAAYIEWKDGLTPEQKNQIRPYHIDWAKTANSVNKEETDPA